MKTNCCLIHSLFLESMSLFTMKLLCAGNKALAWDVSGSYRFVGKYNWNVEMSNNMWARKLIDLTSASSSSNSPRLWRLIEHTLFAWLLRNYSASRWIKMSFLLEFMRDKNSFSSMWQSLSSFHSLLSPTQRWSWTDFSSSALSFW